MTELDKKLQEVAAKDWSYFVDLLGEDAINKAKACIMRKQGGKSITQIQTRLGVTYRQARYACDNCPPDPAPLPDKKIA